MQNPDEAVTPNGRKSVITHSDHEAHLQRLTVFLQFKPRHLLGLKMSRIGRLFWWAGLCRVISVQRPRYEHSNQFRGFAVLSDPLNNLIRVPRLLFVFSAASRPFTAFH